MSLAVVHLYDVPMTHTVLEPRDLHWRPSNQMRVVNTDLAGQLGATQLGARMWRLEPGQASTWHRHDTQEELYMVLEGTGRLRIDGSESLTLSQGSSVLVGPETLRQPFNDTDDSQLWLVVGAPLEAADTTAMTVAHLARLYPDGPRALPPELGGGTYEPT